MPEWTERETLVYILTAMEHSNLKIDYNNAPMPAGRNASACMQRITRVKKMLKSDMDALKNGMPVSDAKANTGAKGKEKRKAEDGGEEKPKKRGRPKKVAEPEIQVKQEATPETDGLAGEKGVEEEV